MKTANKYLHSRFTHQLSGQRYKNQRRIQAAVLNPKLKGALNEDLSRDISPPPTGAQYEGSASSPHIKPEYLQTRIRSPSNIMRAKTINTQQAHAEIPIIQGQTFTQTQKPSTVQHSRRFKSQQPGTGA